MSNRRKLRRAQAHHTSAQARATPATSKSRDALRKQTADERFAKSGSEKLWTALLGWDAERLARIWLCQAIHDGARAQERGRFDTARLIGGLEGHVSGAGKLDPNDLSTAVEVWLSSGDGYDPADPAPKWHLLSNLGAKLGLGTVTPEELQEDWESWTSLGLAARPRAELMTALAQAEQAAVALHGLTKSERMGAVVNLLRAAWTASAYGDDATFDLLRRTGQEWLGTIAGKVRAADNPTRPPLP